VHFVDFLTAKQVDFPIFTCVINNGDRELVLARVNVTVTFTFPFNEPVFDVIAVTAGLEGLDVTDRPDTCVAASVGNRPISTKKIVRRFMNQTSENQEVLKTRSEKQSPLLYSNQSDLSHTYCPRILDRQT
jgi:hypothetical protein